MSRQRYEITGEWSGPQNPAGNYTRYVHREVTTEKSLAEWCEKTGAIQYSDGTMLFLTVRSMKKGERAGKQIHGYDRLIRDCHLFNVASVDELCRKMKEAKLKVEA